MVFHNKYILASSSKSRYNILKKIGFEFDQTSPLCDEEEIKKKIVKENKPKEIAMILSYEKAKSKTFAWLDGEVICHVSPWIKDK